MRNVDTAYRRAYIKGWIAWGRGDDQLESADERGEPDAWYDGYMDRNAGREQWHLARCTDHDKCS